MAIDGTCGRVTGTLDEGLKIKALMAGSWGLIRERAQSVENVFKLFHGDSFEVFFFMFDYRAKSSAVLDKLAPLVEREKEHFREIRNTLGWYRNLPFVLEILRCLLCCRLS